MSVGALAINGGVDGLGIKWWWTELAGWWDGPDEDTDWLQRTGSSGVIKGTSTYGGRAIVVKGVAEMMTKPYATLYPQAADKLATTTDLVEGGSGLMVVQEAVAPKQAAVYRARAPRTRPHVSMRYMEFEVPLLAPDHRKYGTTMHNVAGGAVTNAGNKYATPIVRVAGPAAGPVRVTNATDDGKWVQVGGSMGAVALTGAEVLTIDMDAMTVTINGADYSAYIEPGSRWWDLLAGANALALSGGGTLTTEFRDAYI